MRFDFFDYLQTTNDINLYKYNNITLSDYLIQLNLNAGNLDYNRNVLLQHYGGEQNRLIAYESTL